MTYTFVKPGRGAWTTTGGYLRIRPTSSNPAGFLRYGIGEVMPGSHFAHKINTTFPYEVVYEGIKALQALLRVKPDGVFGPNTAQGAMAAQRALGLTVDGVVGPVTTLGLLRPTIRAAAHDHPDVVITDLGGIGAHESSWDLAAVGYVTGSDVGIFQRNMEAPAAKGLSIAQCVNPSFAANLTASDMQAFFDRWVSTVGVNLARDGMIANHNSPDQARKWMINKAPQTNWIGQYVADVREAGKVF